MIRMLGTALAFFLLAVPAWAGEARLGDITVRDAWARATPPRPPMGGAYMTLVNGGSEPDRLVAAASPVAGTVELHTHVKDGEVMRMTALSGVDLPPGKTVVFAPGGLHVMLIGLAAPLKEGTSFPLSLTFARAGTLTVTVDVRAVGAAGSPAMSPDPTQHQQPMQDPGHRAMHERMHGKP